MKKIAIIASIGLTFAAAGTLTAGLISSNKNNGFDSSVRAVNFSSETITRRIYFVNNEYYEHTWYEGYDMYAYAYSLDESKNNMSEKAIRIYDSYYKGFYCADVTFEGVGASINVIITTSNSWSGAQTATVTIPALSDKTADVIWINNGNPTYGAAALGASEAKCVLDHISTCDPSYAFGYNAYPQLIANFNMQNIEGMEYQSIGDKDKEGHDGYNAAEKVDELERQYNKYGW